MVTLRHDGRNGGRPHLLDVDVVVTPLDGRWRVECDDRVVEGAYLEYAIGEALEIDDEDAIAVATALLDQHLDATLKDGVDGADGNSGPDEVSGAAPPDAPR